MKREFNIEVDCAVCAGKCEEAISKIAGVNSCSINFVMQKMEIDSELEEKDLVKKVLKVARKIEPDFELEV